MFSLVSCSDIESPSGYKIFFILLSQNLRKHQIVELKINIGVPRLMIYFRQQVLKRDFINSSTRPSYNCRGRSPMFIIVHLDSYLTKILHFVPLLGNLLVKCG